MSSTPVTPQSAAFSRRTLVVGAGAAAGAAVLGTALSACGGSESPPATVSIPSDAPAGTLAETSDVPVGGGVITDGVVLTQPKAGTYEAFTAKCTHAGCALSKVVGEEIECPCHGSRFHLDGSVATGPAERPLSKVAIRVDGTAILRAWLFCPQTRPSFATARRTAPSCENVRP